MWLSMVKTIRSASRFVAGIIHETGKRVADAVTDPGIPVTIRIQNK